MLQDISIEVAKGEIVCLIGRNGAGKTTTLQIHHGPDGQDARIGVPSRDKELLTAACSHRFALGLGLRTRRAADRAGAFGARESAARPGGIA